ncbi:MAG: KH domain-containing protein [Chloroflexi bacterium]|nr:KH domain-containing protein [Chloroflexota bacterium]
MRELVEFLAKSLVDHPEAVKVNQLRGTDAIILELSVDPSDKGWVIGRRGRVANAMRSVLRVASSARTGKRVILEIV